MALHINGEIVDRTKDCSIDDKIRRVPIVFTEKMEAIIRQGRVSTNDVGL